MPEFADHVEGFGWINVSGEHGSGKIEPRPFDPQWARNIRDLCKEREIPFFHPCGGWKVARYGVSTAGRCEPLRGASALYRLRRMSVEGRREVVWRTTGN